MFNQLCLSKRNFNLLLSFTFDPHYINGCMTSENQVVIMILNINTFQKFPEYFLWQ